MGISHPFPALKSTTNAMVLARAASCQPAGLALFVDLHAHATKRGVFIYGNHIDDEARQVENKLYALLLAVNSSFFDYNACNFSREHMLRHDRADAGGASAEGAARVAVLRYTGLDRAYTLECNYNSGRLTNHVDRVGPVAQVAGVDVGPVAAEARERARAVGEHAQRPPRVRRGSCCQQGQQPHSAADLPHSDALVLH